jgi:hypothetical protein
VCKQVLCGEREKIYLRSSMILISISNPIIVECKKLEHDHIVSCVQVEVDDVEA